MSDETQAETVPPTETSAAAQAPTPPRPTPIVCTNCGYNDVAGGDRCPRCGILRSVAQKRISDEQKRVGDDEARVAAVAAAKAQTGEK